jgi:hypothetical protein
MMFHALLEMHYSFPQNEEERYIILFLKLLPDNSLDKPED